MSVTQRARSGVPLDKRSLVVTVPGLPWWGVILLAAGVTSIGVLIDAVGGGGELTSAFSTFYFLGCLFAVVTAANNALFTAMAQPPILLFVGVPIAQTLIGKNNSASLRDIAINIAIPLVDRFPIMLTATLAVLIIGGLRYFLLRGRPTAPVRSTRTFRANANTSAARRTAAFASESSHGPAQRRRRNTESDLPPMSVVDQVPQPRRRSTDAGERPAYAARPSYRPSDPEYAPAESYDQLTAPRTLSADPTPPRRSAALADNDQHQVQGHNQSVNERREYPSYGDRRVPEPGRRHSEERMEPFFASGDDVSLPPRRRRPAGTDLPAYPAPRVRYRDRDETPT